jgi:hypothetical protein
MEFIQLLSAAAELVWAPAVALALLLLVMVGRLVYWVMLARGVVIQEYFRA